MPMSESSQPTFEDLEVLAEVSQLLTLLDLDGVLQKVIHLAAKAVGASKASLFLHEAKAVDWDHLFTMRDLSPEQSVKVVTQVLDEGFAGWVMRHKRGDIIYDTSQDKRWIIFPDDDYIQASALCVPLMDGDEVLAVITLVHEQPYHFAPYHLRLMTIIANQASIAIRNAKLFNRVAAQQRQLQTILQSMSDVLLVLDEHGHILLVNVPALMLLQAGSQTDVIGYHLAEFAPRDKVFEPIVEIVNAALTANEQWSFETRSERHRQDFQVTMAVWQDPARDEIGYVVVMHDVTTLRDLHRFKDEMLRLASHDLRSPLALITGYADMILIDTPDTTSPVIEYVDVIKRSVERMGVLIDDLLRVERIRSSPLELHEQTDLGALVKVVLVNTRPSATAKQQAFLTEIQLPEGARVVADAVLLRQSMENLIGNAIKYTPDGGTITVRASADDAHFYFAVQDTGIGISEEHLPYVFEAFYRVKNEHYVQKGSGLGLSLVKNVIQRHSGDIWVTSRVQQGSEFGFWLPLSSGTSDADIDDDDDATQPDRNNFFAD